MQIDVNEQSEQERTERGPFRVRLPFLPEGMGLGDAIASLTKAVGVKPCGGCKQRQEAMNTKVQLSPWET